jgi:methylenetetrahydrofolate reductase (NADPH)
VPLLQAFMRRIEDLGLLEKVFVLVGVGPLRSAKAAEWMRTHVPGLHIPDAVIARMAGAADAAREGRNLCIDLIQEIRAVRGVSGVHLMAYRQEDSVPEIIDRSGVLGGRVPWYPGRDPHRNSNRLAS